MLYKVREFVNTRILSFGSKQKFIESGALIIEESPINYQL